MLKNPDGSLAVPICSASTHCKSCLPHTASQLLKGSCAFLIYETTHFFAVLSRTCTCSSSNDVLPPIPDLRQSESVQGELDIFVHGRAFSRNVSLVLPCQVHC